MRPINPAHRFFLKIHFFQTSPERSEKSQPLLNLLHREMASAAADASNTSKYMGRVHES